METFKRGAGWVTHPKETSRLWRYWTKGPGASKIKWGAPHDFYRCRQHLSKYIGPKYLSQTCAQWHHDALGIWPGEHGEKGKFSVMSEETEGRSLTAAVRSATPPREFFTNPNFTSAAPITVSKSGRIMGHIATWDTCHVGFKDACTAPPKSITDYSYFRLGEVECDNGDMVSVGTITMSTGHADMQASVNDAISHYDHTGTAAAYVVTGEDQYGIWCSGWVHPSLTDEQIVTLRGAKLSGDWRRVQGNLEMVGVLAVNVPGFPIPRASLAASAGLQTSLVAANVVEVDPGLDLKGLVAAALDEAERQKELREKRKAIREYTLELQREQLSIISQEF